MAGSSSLFSGWLKLFFELLNLDPVIVMLQLCMTEDILKNDGLASHQPISVLAKSYQDATLGQAVVLYQLFSAARVIETARSVCLRRILNNISGVILRRWSEGSF